MLLFMPQDSFHLFTSLKKLKIWVYVYFFLANMSVCHIGTSACRAGKALEPLKLEL